MLKRVAVPALVAFCCACAGGPVSPGDARERTGAAAAAPSTQGVSTDGATEWIYNPSKMPPGLIGKNNCSPDFGFAFGADPDFHPVDEADPLQGSCWERQGHDGFVRQQLQAVHFAAAPQCGGGPGDINAIRICRVGGRGQSTPCGPTGNAGCALCTPGPPTCH